MAWTRDFLKLKSAFSGRQRGVPERAVLSKSSSVEKAVDLNVPGEGNQPVPVNGDQPRGDVGRMGLGGGQSLNAGQDFSFNGFVGDGDFDLLRVAR